MNEVLYDLNEAAQRLDIRPATLRAYINQGRARAVRMGRRWKMSGDELDRLTRAGVPSATVAPVTVATPDEADAQREADSLWQAMTSGDAARHNDALRAMFQAPNSVQAIVMQRSAEVAARFYASPEGQAEPSEPYDEPDARAPLAEALAVEPLPIVIMSDNGEALRAPAVELFAPPAAEEVTHRMAALEALGHDLPNRRADAGLGPLDLSGERADVYGYTEREDAQR